MSKFFEGNITRDVELSFLDNGMAMAKFGFAENWKTKGDNPKETSSFYNVVAFGKLAENIAQSLAKGDNVGIDGRLEVNKYKKNDGTEGTSVDIIVNFIGPSLRFAYAVPVKNERDSGGYTAPKYETEEEPF